MRRERIIRQICLLLSIITIVSGMCLFFEQADACFLLRDETQVDTTAMDFGAVLYSGDTIMTQDFSCTEEMLGERNLSVQQNVTRFFGGLRNKIILAISFIGLFLFILILFQTAVDQLDFCSRLRHIIIIRYVHGKDGKKRVHYNIQTAKYCNGGNDYADGRYSCSRNGSINDFSRCLGMVE